MILWIFLSICIGITICITIYTNIYTTIYGVKRTQSDTNSSTSLFWVSQPVDKYNNFNHSKGSNKDFIDHSLELHRWRDISNNKEIIREMTEFLSKHYLNNDDYHYDASDFIDHMDNTSFVMYRKNEGIITSREVNLYGNETTTSIQYVDFLCIHKNARSKYVAPKYIETFAYKMKSYGVYNFLFKKEGDPISSISPWKRENWICKHVKESYPIHFVKYTFPYSLREKKNRERKLGIQYTHPNLLLKPVPIYFKEFDNNVYEIYGMVSCVDETKDETIETHTFLPGIYCGPKDIMNIIKGETISEYPVFYYLYNGGISREISEYTCLLL
jgi:hypothetical protein